MIEESDVDNLLAALTVGGVSLAVSEGLISQGTGKLMDKVKAMPVQLELGL